VGKTSIYLPRFGIRIVSTNRARSLKENEVDQIALYVYMASVVINTAYYARVEMFHIMMEFLMLQARKKGTGAEAVSAKIGKQILVVTILAAIFLPLYNTIATLWVVLDILGISEFGKWKKAERLN
jgi:hypothetical protein